MSTTFYDHKAQRQVAAATADAQLAAAEGTRADTALKMVQVEHARAAAADDRVQRAAATRRADQAETRARRAAVRARLAARVPEVLLSALWAAVIVSPISLAWRAQQSFAEATLHLPAGMSWLFPLAVEAGAWVCAFEAHRRGKARMPIGALVTWMWVLAGVAATIQLLHGTADYGPVAGIALAAMSLLGVLLHHIRQSADTAAAEGRDTAGMRRSVWRKVRFPRLSWAAASIAAAGNGVTIGETAWRQAWIDRYGVGPDSSRRDRKVARLVVRHQRKADRKAAKAGDLVVMGGVILPATLPTLPALSAVDSTPGDGGIQGASATPMSLVPAPVGDLGTPIVQAQQAEQHPRMSDKATALLARVRAEITAGNLPATPSASAIRKTFGGAQDVAAEVRDVLARRAADKAA